MAQAIRPRPVARGAAAIAAERTATRLGQPTAALRCPDGELSASSGHSLEATGTRRAFQDQTESRQSRNRTLRAGEVVTASPTLIRKQSGMLVGSGASIGSSQSHASRPGSYTVPARPDQTPSTECKYKPCTVGHPNPKSKGSRDPGGAHLSQREMKEGAERLG